jgi:hypothetical protein
MKRKAAVALMIAATAFFAACSPSPTAETKKEAPPPPEPFTGRQAFQQMFVQARTWSVDAAPLELHSINLKGVKSGAGKAGAWRATFVSEAHARSRSYTWSAIEGEGLHQGVFADQEERWAGPNADRKPFLIAALRHDSDEAWQVAADKGAAYIAKHPDTPVSYLLTLSNRFPDVAWRVVFGDSVSTSDFSVFVDATSGKLLGLLKG